MPPESRTNPRRSPANSVLERRQRIIDATRVMISDRGIEGITVRDLAQRCGVVVATIYNQFGSREALICEALRVDFETRLTPFDEAVGPVERLEQRVTASARIRSGKLGNYTRSVMFFYFHHDPDPTLWSTMHDHVASDFGMIVRQIAGRDELQDWVDPLVFADDLVTQLYSLACKWTQGRIPRRKLRQRLLLSAATSFAGISLGQTRREFENLARRYRDDASPDATHPSAARRA